MKAGFYFVLNFFSPKCRHKFCAQESGGGSKKVKLSQVWREKGAEALLSCLAHPVEMEPSAEVSLYEDSLPGVIQIYLRLVVLTPGLTVSPFILTAIASSKISYIITVPAFPCVIYILPCNHWPNIARYC